MRLRILLLAILLAPPAASAGGDIRAQGMGGVTLRSAGVSSGRWNPAFLAVPPEPRERLRRWPVPLGAVQILTDLPELDPGSPDFDPLDVARSTAVDPWMWQFGDEPPPAALRVGTSGDPLGTDLDDLRALVPADPFDRGGRARFLTWDATLDLGPEYGVFAVTPIEGFLIHELESAPSTALTRLLEGGDATAGTDYDLAARATLATGVTTAIAYARELPWPGSSRQTSPAGDTQWLDDWWASQDARPRLWAGIAIRRYTGLALVDLDSDVVFTGLDPGEDRDLAIDHQTLYHRAQATRLDRLGGGWGVDLGLVAQWRDYEAGVGATDLLAELTWPDARRDRLTYDEGSQTTLREALPRAEVTSPVPAGVVAHALRRGARTTTAAEWRTGAGGASLHLGGEVRVRSPLALRAGLERDTRQTWQGSVGVGLRWGGYGLDVGLSTHSRALDGDRGAALGIALVARP